MVSVTYVHNVYVCMCVCVFKLFKLKRQVNKLKNKIDLQ